MAEDLRLPKWNEILIAIYKAQQRKPYAQKLNREIKGSLTHLREVVKALADFQLIEIYEGKKAKQIVLTEKGRQVAEKLISVREYLRRTESLPDSM